MKLSKANINRIKKLMGLSLEINVTTTHTVFIEDRGHIGKIRIAIHLDGWSDGSEAIFDEYIKYNDVPTLEKMIKKLERLNA